MVRRRRFLFTVNVFLSFPNVHPSYFSICRVFCQKTKNPVFVTQIAKICNKVTIFFNSTDRKRHFTESFLSVEWLFLLSVEFYLATIALFCQCLQILMVYCCTPIYTLSYSYWPLPTTMDAVSATIVTSGRAQI